MHLIPFKVTIFGHFGPNMHLNFITIYLDFPFKVTIFGRFGPNMHLK